MSKSQIKLDLVNRINQITNHIVQLNELNNMGFLTVEQFKTDMAELQSNRSRLQSN